MAERLRVKGVVDSHTHVWPRGLVHPAQQRPVPMQATPEDLLATLDASRVERVIVSPAMVHPDNGYVLGAAATVPARIGAVVGIDPCDASAVAAMEDHAAHGAIGVRVNLGAEGLEGPAALAGLDRLVDFAASAAVALQWTIRLPYGHLIERAAARSPDLRQVLDHLGLPIDARDMSELVRIRDLAAIPSLHIKLSGMYALSKVGYPYQDTWPWAEAIVAAFGPERTMWASDWPLAGEFATHAEHLALVELLPFLTNAGRAEILHETAHRFWHLERTLADL